MILENQVCSLEQSIKFKELGIEQKTLWQWKVNNVQTVVISTPMAFWVDKYVPPIGNKYYAAFTVSELSEMIRSGERLWNRMLSRINGGNSCLVFYKPSFLAEFLIELLEARYLDVETCNEMIVAKGSI